MTPYILYTHVHGYYRSYGDVFVPPAAPSILSHSMRYKRAYCLLLLLLLPVSRRLGRMAFF